MTMNHHLFVAIWPVAALYWCAEAAVKTGEAI